MAAIPYVLFVTVPIIAALALDTDAFVPFFILFCAIAALCTPPSGASTSLFDEDASRADQKELQTRNKQCSNRRELNGPHHAG